MPDRYQESHIRQIPMFSHLSEYHFQLVARAFQVGHYKPGDYVLIQATEVPGLMIVADGQLLKVQVTPENTLSQQGIVVEGQAIYPNASFSVIYAETHLQAVRPTNVLALTRSAMTQLLINHPDLKIALSQIQAKSAPPQHAPLVAQKSKKSFKGQRENEAILLRTRRHWFSLMNWMWAPIMLVIFGMIISAGLPQIAIVALPATIIFGLSGAIYIVLEWANDSVIITNQRVIHITQTILTFHEKRDEVALESIQEANAQIPTFNFFANVLRYGDVELKTAGSKGNYILDFMPNPVELQNLILEDAKQFVVGKEARERQTMIADVERWKDEPYRAKDVPMPQQGKKNGASERNLKNIYTTGEGPISPFVMTFPTDTGGIVYRKHWFVWMKMIALPAFWLFLTFIGAIALLITPLSSIGFIGWISVFVALLIGVVWFYLTDWDWRHDYYLITDNDISLINQRPLWLQNERDQVLLKQVDNVVAETKGFFQQVFKYGNVKIALVGADTHKVFDNVAKPGDVQGEITRRQRLLKHNESEALSRARRDEIGEYLSIYHHSQPESDTGQTFSADLPLPYEPSRQQAPPAQMNPTPSPFGQRPSMSQGRPYTPTSQPPPARPQRSPYHPRQAPNQGGQQGQYPPQQGNQAPYQGGQQGQYPQQGNQVPNQGGQQGQHPQQGNQAPYQGGQPRQYPQQGNQGQPPNRPPSPPNRPPKFPPNRKS